MTMQNNSRVTFSLVLLQPLLYIVFFHLWLYVDLGTATPEAAAKNQQNLEVKDPSGFKTDQIPTPPDNVDEGSNLYCNSAGEDCENTDGSGKGKIKSGEDIKKDFEGHESMQYFNMDRWVGRVALVTGASSGIGADVARTLVKYGIKVIGCARRVERIQAMAKEIEKEKGILIPYRCDLSKPEERTEMFSFIKENYGGVDICINNAAFGSGIALLDGDSSEWSRMLEVNVVAVGHLSQMSIQSMRERGVNDGYIVNMNSMNAYRLFPGRMSMYPASKFALRILTEGFRRELRSINSSIRISEISLALTSTEFIQVSHGYSEKQCDEIYSQAPHLSPSDITNTLLYMLSTPPHVEVHDILVRPTHQTE